MTPGGPSGLAAWREAVREFNVQRDSYGAEFGKRPGGQVVIVTQSGGNQWHGAVYEYLRHNALDAATFRPGLRARHFNGNQSWGWGLFRWEDSEDQDILSRQLRRVPAEPAPNIGGVRAGSAAARAQAAPAFNRF